MRTGLLLVGAHIILTIRLVREDICRRSFILDVPYTTTIATTPTTSVRMHRAATIHIAESVPAASNPRVPIAESANMVRLAESPTPTPGAGGCCAQACLIVPICYCRRWVCILMRTGLLQEGALVTVAHRLVWGNICRRIFILDVPYTTTIATTPTASVRMHRAATIHIAESVPAASDPRVPIAESANMMRLAESPTPTPSAGGCCAQACLIVPICYCRRRVCILMR